MSQTVDIGAARVRLIVDADDFQPIIEQGKSAVRGFGQEAQTAYDRTEKATRRAANSLLDYVNSLGRTDTAMDRYVRNASRLGVEKPVIDAAVASWQRHTDSVEEDTRSIADQASQVARTQAVWKQFQAEQKAFAVAGANKALAGDELFAYVNNLGKAETAMDRYVAAARKAGVEEPLINLATEAWEKHNFEVDKARLKQEQLNKVQREASAKQANGDAFIQQLKNTEQAAGKTYYELLRLKAAELGVSDAAAPFIAGIERQNKAMGRGTISAKQYSLAIRQLPAQFTDVFVSLAAGQSPLLVLLQQGGQVKDMFGGVQSAIKAVGKEALLLARNPYILLAATIAAVAVAAYQADTAITKLAISAAKGNGLAGTAKDLAEYSKQLNALENINLSSAEAAVGKLAESGRLTGENFRLASEAAARWASVTGESVDDVAGKFEQIARDPMAAILDGTVKITAAQYDMIKALVDAGDTQKAITELVKIYYGQINNNTATVINNLSNTAIAWRDIKDAATGAWRATALAFDETARFFNFLNSSRKKFNEAAKEQPWWLKLIPGSDSLAVLQGLYNAEPEGFAAAGAAATKGVSQDEINAARAASIKKLSLEQLKAIESVNKRMDDSGTHADKLAAKVRVLNAELSNLPAANLAALGITRGNDGAFSGPGYDRLVKALDDKTKADKKVRSARAAPQGPDPTRAIRESEQTALFELRKIQQEFDFIYADKLTTIESYYGKSIFLAREEADVQIKSNNDQIAALTGRKFSEDKIAALRQENRTIEEKFATTKAKLDRDEVLATRERTAALRDYSLQLADTNSQLALGFAQQTSGLGRGGRNSEINDALENARIQSENNIRDIRNQLTDSKISPAEAASQQQAQYDALVEKQRIIQQGYADIASAEADWKNGSVRAWEDWQQQVGDIATQVAKITTDAIGGMAQSISDKITEGKSNFKDYINDINKQILDFVIKQQLTSFFKSIGKATEGTSFGSWLTTLGGALFGSASAQGNVFSGGALASYRNQIVSQPTYFAKGGVPNVNIMGERSGKPHEAIMPLTRTVGGDLGVKVTGQQQKTINTTQNFYVPGVPDRTTRDQLAIKTLGAAQRAARRN